MAKYAPGYTGPMSTAGSNPKKPKTMPTRPTPMPKEALLPKSSMSNATTTPKGPAGTPRGMAKGGATKKGMAYGGVVKTSAGDRTNAPIKGMAYGGVVKTSAGDRTNAPIKGMAYGGVVKTSAGDRTNAPIKGMAKGGMAKKGCK